MVNIVTLTLYRITKEPLGMPMKDHLDWVEVGRCTLNVCSIIPWAGVLDCKKSKSSAEHQHPSLLAF